MDPDVRWQPVQDFLRRLPVRHVQIVAGTPEWCELDDADPAKLAAVLVAGSRWALHCEIERLAHRRHAQKEAALEVAQALDWSRVAKQVRDRDQAHRSGAYIPRRSAS